MSYPKAKLTKKQQKIFEELIANGTTCLVDDANSFVIAGMLRIPDFQNDLDEPEIQFAFFDGEEAEKVTDIFIDMRKRQEEK